MSEICFLASDSQLEELSNTPQEKLNNTLNMLQLWKNRNINIAQLTLPYIYPVKRQ